jgi:hypothetical protein
MTISAKQLMSDNLINITEFYNLLFSLKKQTFWQLGELVEIIKPTKYLKVGDRIRVTDVCLEAFQLENGEWIGRFEAKTKPIGTKDYKYDWSKIMKVQNVLCNSYEDTIELLTEADNVGLTYIDGSRYTNSIKWNKNIVYMFGEGCVCNHKNLLIEDDINFVKSNEIMLNPIPSTP